ncbi:MAG: hypothetical protein ACK56I_26440, partial [bacterium]
MRIGRSNSNLIKEVDGLAVSIESTWLSAWRPFINDTAGNPVSTINFNKEHALRVTGNYVPDMVAPYLLSWFFDLRYGIVSLVFSETINVRYANYSSVVLTNG